MFGISGGELAIVLVFGFLLFGPDKLPQMGHTIGRALRQFRETQEKLTAVVQTEVVDPMAAAVQAPSKPKKSGANPTGATADTDDLDADIADDTISEPARKKETFAERRARLAAEKAEKEAAVAEAPAAEGKGAAEATASETPAAESVSATEPTSVEAPKAEEPAVRTTEDLYARRPRKKKAVVEAESAASADAPATDVAAPTETVAEGGEQ